MKNNIRKLIILPFLSLIGLAALFGRGDLPNFGAMPVLIESKELFAQKPTVAISLKPLTDDESEKYLNTDALQYGYKPVQITVENQSSDPYLINDESVGLSLVPTDKIASAAKRSSLPAAITLKIAGFVFWPLSIPSTMHGIKTLQTYQKMKKDLYIKSVKEEIIPPYTVMNRVFFVKTEDLKDSFYVTLINQETLETKVFAVNDMQVDYSPILSPLPLPEENYYLTHEK
jgi:hypothetical protein